MCRLLGPYRIAPPRRPNEQMRFPLNVLDPPTPTRLMTQPTANRASLCAWLSAALILTGTFAVSCGSESGSGEDDDQDLLEDDEIDNVEDVDCNTTTETLIQNFDIDSEAIPSWEQIDCYTSDLSRLAYPSNVIMAAPIPPDSDGGGGDFPGVWDSLQTYTTFLQSWPEAEVSELSDFPPFTSIDGTTSFYRESDDRWDEKLRSKALNAIWAKQQGYRVRVTHFFPPPFFDEENWSKLGAQNINSAETFLDWWRTEYIPEREELAIMAERVKAEILMPWDIEPGIFLRTFGDDWLDDMSTGSQVILAQTMIDELHDALRPLFTGTLSVIIYDRYAAFGQHWDQINLSEWDQANFVFFTEGNLEATQRYLDDQLAGYMAIVQRSDIPWIAQEITVDGDVHRNLLEGSDPTFEAIEEDIYRMIFETLADQPVKPIGIGITTGYIETSGAATYVHDALEDIAENGF